MIRIAFTLIGGYEWFGGYNYQLNLLRALVKYEKKRIKPYIFLGNDVDKKILGSFQNILGLTIVQSDVFNKKATSKRLVKAIVFGKDNAALKLFNQHDIDLTFEAANFYGWRFPLPVLAWIPDLQHRLMRHLFGHLSYFKREIGFQFQIRSGRQILLSSEDAKSTLEQFYPYAKGNTHIARFAVPKARYEGDSTKLKEKYQLPNHFYLLPNQFWQHKNHHCVIEALAILKKQGVQMTVIATGNTHDPRNPRHFEDIQLSIQSHQLKDNFRILGPVPYQDLLGLMKLCKALINPSLFEGWSTTVEEAKSLGIPMLLSNLNVHQEQASGLANFFDPNAPETLAKLLSKSTVLDTYKQEDSIKNNARNVEERIAKFAKTFTDIAILTTTR